MLDHIAETYNFLNMKYGKGLHWLLAGDTNDLKLDPILSLSPNLKSVVLTPTRLNPDKILDNIITDMSKWYQIPECLPALDADPGSGGKPSDHLIVVMKPVSVLENKPARVKRQVEVRPLKQSGIDLFSHWIKSQDWKEVLDAESVDRKSEILQSMLMSKCDEFLPRKMRIISSDDQPFCTEEMKRLKRLKSREFHKHRRSIKWRELNMKYKKAVSQAKKNYYKKIIKDLKTANPSQWYSKLKRLCSFDQHKSDPVIVESIKHLTDKEQAEVIADKFSKVSQEYDPLRTTDILVPEFSESSIPVFTVQQVRHKLEKIKTNKSVPPNDVPPKIIKMFAAEIAIPLCDIINASIRLGAWSKLYKAEMVTPVPKCFPPKSPDELRNISGLLTFDKNAEQLVSELIISDMANKLDKSQYANQRDLSLQHYLVKMIDKILSETDNNAKGEINAVLATLFDWKEAFPRQCPKLGVEAFIKCGVRPSLIPLMINYLQDRTMRVKWHGHISEERKLNGGGPQGATFGIWEYLAQSNDSADCVQPENRFKFVDDLTVLEKINLLITGLSSINCRAAVPNDIPSHNQFISAEHLKSQEYIRKIKEWTDNQKMILNAKKTKVMIFNFTNKYQFTTRLVLNDQNIEIVKQAKLLGVLITDDLKWDTNTELLVKKANIRMELLRKVAHFNTNIEDMRNLYILYVRSILEQSCVVWNSSLTCENSSDLERVQKAAVRIIMGKNFENYEDALVRVNLPKLSDRRNELCLKFAKKCTQNEKTQSMFPLKRKLHEMEIRNSEEYQVNHANTEPMKKSAIPNMQRILNGNKFIKRNPG